MLEVAEHYRHFGGKSPINAQNRALIAALEAELKQIRARGSLFIGGIATGIRMLTDTLRQMAAGRHRAFALAFVTFRPIAPTRVAASISITSLRARENAGPKAPLS